MADQLVGWVFVGYPDEHLRTLLRPRAVRFWSDARTIEKVVGQPVLYLQTRDEGSAWIGSGAVVELEERWKAFGVHVETRSVLPRLLRVIAATRQSDITRSVLSLGGAPWENRTLATHLGLAEFRSRTPYLEQGRDVRLTASDWHHLTELQPALLDLWPSA